MSVVEDRLDAILHDLEELPAEQVAQIFRQLLQPSQADFAQALRVFFTAALTTDSEVERLAGEPKDVRGESDRLLRDQRIKAEAHAVVLDQDFLDSSGVGVALGASGINKREAASDLGASPWRILLREILPNSLGPITVLASLGLGTAIVWESALSFLGFGLPPPAPTWGWSRRRHRCT